MRFRFVIPLVLSTLCLQSGCFLVYSDTGKWRLVTDPRASEGQSQATPEPLPTRSELLNSRLEAGEITLEEFYRLGGGTHNINEHYRVYFLILMGAITHYDTAQREFYGFGAPRNLSLSRERVEALIDMRRHVAELERKIRDAVDTGQSDSTVNQIKDVDYNSVDGPFGAASIPGRTANIVANHLGYYTTAYRQQRASSTQALTADLPPEPPPEDDSWSSRFNSDLTTGIRRMTPAQFARTTMMSRTRFMGVNGGDGDGGMMINFGADCTTLVTQLLAALNNDVGAVVQSLIDNERTDCLGDPRLG